MDTAQSVASPDEIREKIEETRASLVGKLESLETEVRSSVDGASESVKSTVQDIKNVFHPSYWVSERPWTSVGLAVVAGALAGAATRTALDSRGQRAQLVRRAHAVSSSARDDLVVGEVERPRGRGLLDRLAPEIDSIRAVALTSVLDIVGEFAKSSLPPTIKPQMGRVIDEISAKLRVGLTRT